MAPVDLAGPFAAAAGSRTAQRGVLAAALAAAALAGCGGDPPADAPPPAENRLSADGAAIVDETGRPVMLRGANLGAWMFHETWISLFDHDRAGRIHVLGEAAAIGAEVDAALAEVGPPAGEADAGWLDALRAALTARVGAESTTSLLGQLADYPSLYDDSDLPLRQLLETRFGPDGRDQLLDTFQGAWIREPDLAWLADQGFNLVRVPMGFRSLVTGSDLAPPTVLTWNEAAFARLDALLDACEALGIYAVLDLQESPGGHNDYSGPATLYDDPAMQALTVELWQELSRRFGDRDIVAAYSLLAEPFSAPSDEVRDAMYDQLIDALRAQGDDHLVVVHDGFRGMYTLPDPATRGWTNVLYSTHLFEWDVASAEDWQGRITLFETLFEGTQADHGVPYFIGSFSTMQDQAWAYDGARQLVELFERQGWSWSVWTLKRIDDPLHAALWDEATAWGLLGRLDGELERPDAYLDDQATLRAKLAGYAELALEPNQPLVDALTSWRASP